MDMQVTSKSNPNSNHGKYFLKYDIYLQSSEVNTPRDW